MALSLLRKWQEEDRLVQAALVLGGTRCMIIGSITRIDTDRIWITNSTEDGLKEHNGLIIQIADVLRFSFEDTRFLSKQDANLAKKLEESFECSLSLDMGACKCAIFVFSPLNADST